jgi:hypothetical protein
MSTYTVGTIWRNFNWPRYPRQEAFRPNVLHWLTANHSPVDRFQDFLLKFHRYCRKIVSYGLGVDVVSCHGRASLCLGRAIYWKNVPETVSFRDIYYIETTSKTENIT